MAGSGVGLLAALAIAIAAAVCLWRRESAHDRQERSRLFWIAREWRQGDPL